MKNLKKLPTKQLEKFSNILTQLGLVLALFVVYVALEHQTEEKKNLAEIYEPDDGYEYEIDLDRPIVFQVDKPKPKLIPKAPTFKDLSKIEKVDNDIQSTIETVIDPPVDNTTSQIFNPNDIKEITEEPPIVETVPFILIEEVPIYKGCEDLSQEESKKCFVKKITKHVQRNFDPSLAEDLGLKPGKHKIYAAFVIDKKGKIIDVKIKAPHKSLEKEAQKIVDKIPQFTPGKQRNNPVKVKYTLPITFKVQ